MDPVFAYYGLDFLAVGLSLFALLRLRTRPERAAFALLIAHVLWLAIGVPWTHLFAVFLVDALFVARYREVRARRRHIARQFATRPLSRSAQGIDILC